MHPRNRDRRLEYSVQLSGNTVYISNRASCCRARTCRCFQPDVSLAGEIHAARVTQAIARHFEYSI